MQSSSTCESRFIISQAAQSICLPCLSFLFSVELKQGRNWTRNVVVTFELSINQIHQVKRIHIHQSPMLGVVCGKISQCIRDNFIQNPDPVITLNLISIMVQ